MQRLRSSHRAQRVKKNSRVHPRSRAPQISARRATNQHAAETSKKQQAPAVSFHSPVRYAAPAPRSYTTDELREEFLAYFTSKGHHHIPSSSIVPIADPTLLFTAAGMVPFKNIFLGVEQPIDGHTRVTTAQRCLRAGGKHNDLENVGYTARHHTFFEMLGNFSFGDYFKRDAMTFAWDFLTNVLKIPHQRLLVSVFTEDDESAALWEDVTNGVLSEKKKNIVRMGAEDNFWQMGDTGPCGPCTEIYFDQQEEIDGERYLEIWNLVFMQYDRQTDGTLLPLKNKCVDTGMGLERLAAVMQGVRNNFENDVFLHATNAVVETSPNIVDILHQQKHKNDNDVLPPSSNDNSSPTLLPHDSQLIPVPSPSTPTIITPSISLSHQKQLIASRVVIDHLRAILALFYDGIQPGSAGRNYVLRRIIRRACRYGLDLGHNEPFLFRHVELVAGTLKAAIPDIQQYSQQFANDVFREEQLFNISMTKGVKLISDEIASRDAQLDQVISTDPETGKQITTLAFPPSTAFTLYEAYGFPFDLTALCLKSHGYTLDVDAAEGLLNQQKQASRDAAALGALGGLKSDTANDSFDLGQHDIDRMFDQWKSQGVQTQFVGYSQTRVPQAQVVALHSFLPFRDYLANDIALPPNDDQCSNLVAIGLDHCPFYATGGGQVSDVGSLTMSIPRVALLNGASQHDAAQQSLDANTRISIPVLRSIKHAKHNMSLLVCQIPAVELNNTQISPQRVLSAISQRILHGATVDAQVDEATRQATAAHHTSTHLLHAALQNVLTTAAVQAPSAVQSSNDHVNEHITQHHSTVKQAGSHVHPDGLRFDFGFMRPLTAEEIVAVENQVNTIAKAGMTVVTDELPIDEAKARGAMALFGERYGDTVRVVTIPGQENSSNAFSMELCGGTHVANTNACFPFVITSETGLSSGTRRIEALAGQRASEYLLQQHHESAALKTDAMLKLHPLADMSSIVVQVNKLKQKHDSLLLKVRLLEKQQREMMMKNISGSATSSAAATDASALQDNTDPFNVAFWPAPADWNIVCGALPRTSNMSTTPLAIFHSVPEHISSDYTMYRKLSEELFQTQDKKYREAQLKDGLTADQLTTLHVFIAENTGKALIYSQQNPKSKESTTLAANALWKDIMAFLPRSKGGGNNALAQGTFDFSTIKSYTDTIDTTAWTEEMQTPSTRLNAIMTALSAPKQ